MSARVLVKTDVPERSRHDRIQKTEVDIGMKQMDILGTLYRLAQDRSENPLAGSYTNYLLDKGRDLILRKIGEEAVELILAGKNGGKEEVIHEAADVLYHLTILLFDQGVSWDEVITELEKRREEGA